jgi:hypothetical protein
MYRRLSASAERSTSGFRPAAQLGRQGRNFLQLQLFAGTRTASVPIFKSLCGRQVFLRATKISNINAPLRQKQQQELRVKYWRELFGSYGLAQQKQPACSHSAESRCIFK